MSVLALIMMSPNLSPLKKESKRCSLQYMTIRPTKPRYRSKISHVVVCGVLEPKICLINMCKVSPPVCPPTVRCSSVPGQREAGSKAVGLAVSVMIDSMD